MSWQKVRAIINFNHNNLFPTSSSRRMIFLKINCSSTSSVHFDPHFPVHRAKQSLSSIWATTDHSLHWPPLRFLPLFLFHRRGMSQRRSEWRGKRANERAALLLPRPPNAAEMALTKERFRSVRLSDDATVDGLVEFISGPD